ncbi:hypothetical protein NMG60_11029418 [Bertholletia excelsa]
MYGSGSLPVVSRDASLLFAPNIKHPDDESMKSKGLMNSDLYHHQSNQQNSGLLRYSSAPSSFFASLIDRDNSGCSGSDDFLSPHQTSSAESEDIFAGFMSCSGSGGDSEPHGLQFPTAVKHETQQQSKYSASASTQMIYQTSLNHHDLPTYDNSGSTYSNLDGLCKFGSGVAATALEIPAQGNTSSGNCSNLIRQNSSPAGFFSNLTTENGFGIVSEVDNLRVRNGTNGKASPTTGFNSHINFSSGPSSGSRFMPRIAENGNESTEANNPDNEQFHNGNSNNRYFSAPFQNDTWHSGFTGLKRNRDDAVLNEIEIQDGCSSRQATGLTHHLSLPRTSAEMAAIDKLVFQQDSVLFKARAKRGCATHPRSIAERNRRTRISERMKKLQDLFPNLDKQTSTADMLDQAVESIKDLQKQVKMLTDTRARCTCSRA